MHQMILESQEAGGGTIISSHVDIGHIRMQSPELHHGY